MVKTEKKEFQMRVNDVNKLLNDLNKYNIYPEKSDSGFTFMIQSGDNIVYDIQVNIIEKFSEEEQLFMFNAYPHIKTFKDIQMRLFGKVRWK